MGFVNSGVSMLALALACSASGFNGDGQEHFHPKGKPPSTHTLEVFERARATLPFADRQDFEEHKRGFIARPESGIKNVQY